MSQNVKFFLKMLLVIVLVVAILLPLNMLYIRGATYSGAQSGMEKFENVPEHIEFANFGPSYGMSCFNYDALKENGETCFNFSLSMQDIYHDYSLYQTYADNFKPGAVVAITVSYFSFCSNNDAPSAIRYYKILENSAIKGYTFENDFSANYLPVYGKGSALLRDLLNDFLNSVMRISATDQKIPQDESTLASELDSDSAVGIMSITNGNLNIYQNYIQENEDLLVQWIEEMQQAGLKPVLVQTPYWHTYASGFDKELLSKCYVQPLNRVMQKTNVPLLDFTTEAHADYNQTPEYFNNCDHVSPKGAVEFMDRYLSEIKQLGLLKD